MVAAILYGLLALWATASPLQETRPTQERGKTEEKQDQKKHDQKQAEQTGNTDKPLDESDAAARALKRLLEGKTHGPEAKPPQNKPKPAQGGEQKTTPPGPGKQEAGKQKPGEQQAGKQSGGNPPGRNNTEKVSEPDAAAGALQKLLGQQKKPNNKINGNTQKAKPPDNVKLKPIEQNQPQDQSEEAARALEEQPVHDETKLQPQEAIPVHGSASLWYRLRKSDQDRAEDLRGLLGVDIGNAEKDPVTVHLLGRGSVDIGSRGPDNIFNGIDQTYGKRLTGRLYDAYADIHAAEPFEIARLGRQTNYDTPEVLYFDGARLESKRTGELQFWYGGYVGVPTRLFESSPQGKFTGGLEAGFEPLHGTRLRFDWMHVDDEVMFGPDKNDLLGVALWQNVTEHADVHARYTWLENKNRDLLVRGNGSIVDWDMDVHLSYYQLLETQGAYAIEFDPFYEQAFEYHPYQQLTASFNKRFASSVQVDGGVDVRRLVDPADEGQFNREFERVFLSTQFLDLPTDILRLTLTGEYFNTHGAEDTSALEADLTALPRKGLELSAGTSYALYKYDSFTQRERDHVRTYYATGQYEVSKDLRFRLSYVFETDPFDDYHTLVARILWTF